MIISASRRTDIPACYAPWLFQRLREGFVLVRNPRNPRQISQISLSPEVVDGIVLWTKNPLPLLDGLELLRPYPFYVQATVTPYGTEIERGLPAKETVVLPAICRLSEKIGAERVIWRYDPILLNERYTAEFHLEAFGRLARCLCTAVRRVTISFIELSYRSTRHNAAVLGAREVESEERLALAAGLSRIANVYGLEMDACAQELDYSKVGIGQAHCVDKVLFERLLGSPLRVKKATGQRAACGCMESIDIGMYNTCQNGCVYCYANYLSGCIAENAAQHDPLSPLLIGTPSETEEVRIRPMRSCKALDS